MLKNKNGFIATSIIFSFFIVFLMLLVINLTSYAQNRILMNQVKKDIKLTTNLTLPENTETEELESCDTLAEIKTIKEINYICAPRNYNNCINYLTSFNGNGNNYKIIPITPKNVAILTSKWDTIKQNSNIIYFGKTNDNELAILESLYNTVLNEPDLTGVTSKGAGGVYQANLDSCITSDKAWQKTN